MRIYLCFSFCFVLTFVTRFGHRSIHSTKNTLQEVNVLRVDLRGNLFWRDLSKLLHRIILLFLRSVFFLRRVNSHSFTPFTLIVQCTQTITDAFPLWQKKKRWHEIHDTQRREDLRVGRTKQRERGEYIGSDGAVAFSPRLFVEHHRFFLSFSTPFSLLFFPFYTVTPFLSNLLLSGAHIIDVSFT